MLRQAGTETGFATRFGGLAVLQPLTFPCILKNGEVKMGNCCLRPVYYDFRGGGPHLLRDKIPSGGADLAISGIV